MEMTYMYMYIIEVCSVSTHVHVHALVKTKEKLTNLHDLGWLYIQSSPGVTIDKALFQSRNPNQFTTLNSL